MGDASECYLVLQNHVLNELKYIKKAVDDLKSSMEEMKKDKIGETNKPALTMEDLMPNKLKKTEKPEKPVWTLEQLENEGAKRSTEFTSPHSSYYASTISDQFFHQNCSKSMCSERVEGVLYSPSSHLQLKPNDPRHMQKTMHTRSVNGQSYALFKDDGCVWVKCVSPPPPENIFGYSHYVTAVTNKEEKRVLVDWSLRQFATIPDDLLLFIPTQMATHKNIFAIDHL